MEINLAQGKRGEELWRLVSYSNWSNGAATGSRTARGAYPKSTVLAQLQLREAGFKHLAKCARLDEGWHLAFRSLIVLNQSSEGRILH